MIKLNLCHPQKLSEQIPFHAVSVWDESEFSSHSSRHHWASLLCLLGGEKRANSIYHLQGISEPKQLDLQAHCSNFREYPIRCYTYCSVFSACYRGKHHLLWVPGLSLELVFSVSLEECSMSGHLVTQSRACWYMPWFWALARCLGSHFCQYLTSQKQKHCERGKAQLRTFTGKITGRKWLLLTIYVAHPVNNHAVTWLSPLNWIFVNIFPC